MAFVSFFVQGSVRVRVSYLVSQSAAFSSESAVFRRKMDYGLSSSPDTGLLNSNLRYVKLSSFDPPNQDLFGFSSRNAEEVRLSQSVRSPFEVIRIVSFLQDLPALF